MPSRLEKSSPERAELCKTLYLEGLPASEVAKQVGVTKGTVYYFLHRMAIPRRRKTHSYNQAKILSRTTKKQCKAWLDQGMTIRDIAVLLRTSPQTATSVVYRLGLRPNGHTHLIRRVDAYGYAHVLMKGHPRANVDGYVREHILVWETANGRPLPPGYTIHHLNGIKDDNRLENLVALTKHEHNSHLVAQMHQDKIRQLEHMVWELRAEIKNLKGG